jgi:hypothetical protein
MRKFNTARQLHAAISNAYRLRLTVGATGDIAESLAQAIVATGCYKATLWGFDAEGNNIVEFKSLT